jgi:hypothetical protein
VAALITPEQLIVYLDLPAGTQPTDRAQLACDLVIDAVTQAAGGTLAEPYAAGLKGIALSAAARLYDNPTALRSKAIDDASSTYAGSYSGVLTEQERAQVARAVGSGGRPLYSFPEWDWSWTAAPASSLSD